MTGASRASGAHADAGTGGVLALALVAATVLVALAVLTLGSALAVRQRVIAAADAGALAAADALLGVVADDPCRLAREVAAAHRVAFAGCVVEGAEVVVTMRADAAGLPIQVSSRAGPPR